MSERAARNPRRALDLCTRRTIREFQSLLSSADLPEIAHVLPYSYRPPDGDLTLSRAVQVGIVFAGDAPEQSAPERTRIKERLKEIADRSCQNTQTAADTHFVWDSELPPPGAGDESSPQGKIRNALDADGWTLDHKEPLEMAGARHAAHVRFAAASHVVGRYGGTQDDAFAAVQIPGGHGAVYAVADGVGARHHAGLFSSMAAQQALRSAYGVPLRDLVRQIGTELDAVNRAPEVVEATFDGRRGNAATTLVVARSTVDALDVVWVGDSRAYLWTPAEGLTQITADQHDGHGTCCLGVNHEVVPDPLEESLPALGENARLLLCTDGVTNALPDGRIEAILEETVGSPQDAVNRILSEVVPCGGDNATALVAEAPLEDAAGERDAAYRPWFGRDGRVADAAPGSSITGIESFEPLRNVLHVVAYGKDRTCPPIVLIGTRSGTKLLDGLQEQAESYKFEFLRLKAKDIPTIDSLAKAIDPDGGSEGIATLIAGRCEAAKASSGGDYGRFALLVDDAHELDLDVGRALWEATRSPALATALIVLAGPPALRDTVRAMDVSPWERVLKAEA